MINVDYFKRINDKFGHPTGDAVLVDVARFRD
jgi:diguanylate cyclase (GGDEF)-like protein